METALDRPGGDGDGAGTERERKAGHLPGADRRAEGACRGHQLRGGKGAREACPPRCHEPCVRLWAAVPEGGGDHSSGRDLVLCGGQHRHYRDARGAEACAQEACERDRRACGVCGEVQESADACLHALPAGTAHDCRQARHTLDAGVFDGSGGSGVCDGQPETAGV